MRLLGLIVTFLAGLLSVGPRTLAQPADIDWLSASRLNTDGDRVVAFDLKAADCSIRSIPDVPPGWFLSITNDASGTAEITANAQVGAAALSAGYFMRFVGLRRQASETPISHLALEVVVTKDFVHERHIVVPPGDLTLSNASR
jgi:hypothetical protein